MFTSLDSFVFLNKYPTTLGSYLSVRPVCGEMRQLMMSMSQHPPALHEKPGRYYWKQRLLLGGTLRGRVLYSDLLEFMDPADCHEWVTFEKTSQSLPTPTVGLT
jgi:hypothetical protein